MMDGPWDRQTNSSPQPEAPTLATAWGGFGVHWALGRPGNFACRLSLMMESVSIISVRFENNGFATETPRLQTDVHSRQPEHSGWSYSLFQRESSPHILPFHSTIPKAPNGLARLEDRPRRDVPLCRLDHHPRAFSAKGRAIRMFFFGPSPPTLTLLPGIIAFAAKAVKFPKRPNQDLPNVPPLG
jgi:hypothetical protein